MTAILEGEEEAAKSRPHSQDLGPRRGNTLETLPPQPQQKHQAQWPGADKPVSKDKNPPSER